MAFQKEIQKLVIHLLLVKRKLCKVLVPGATAVLRDGPNVDRGDSAQKTGPEFGWEPAKRMSSEMH